ncbi:MAG: MFS transporter [Bacteroidales bacterium]
MKNRQIPEGYIFTKRYTNYIFILLFLLYMFDYVDRTVITSLFPFLKSDWKLTDKECGMLVSAVYTFIVIFTFPVSIIIDRWSRKGTIGIMALIWSIATGLGAFTKTFSQLKFVRALIGIGEAGYAPGGSALISALYPKEKRSWMMGLWNASIPLGSALGIGLGGLIAVKWGWRHALGIVALPGIIIAVLFFFVKDYKTISLEKNGNQDISVGKNKKLKMSLKDIFLEFIKKPSLILTYFGMTAVVFVTTSIMTWLSTYFIRVQGMEIGPAGLKASVVMLLAIVGAPLGGFLADRWNKKKGNARMLVPAISSFISAFLLFFAFTVKPGQFQYLVLLSFGISITIFLPAAAAVTQDVVHAGLRATSYALAVVIQNLFGATTAPIVMGAISDATNIQTAFQLLPFSLVLAGVLFFAGSFFYVKDLAKVPKVEISTEDSPVV